MELSAGEVSALLCGSCGCTWHLTSVQAADGSSHQSTQQHRRAMLRHHKEPLRLVRPWRAAGSCTRTREEGTAIRGLLRSNKCSGIGLKSKALGSEPESLRLNIRRMSFPDRTQPEVQRGCKACHARVSACNGTLTVRMASGRRSSGRVACLWGKDALCTLVSNPHGWIV